MAESQEPSIDTSGVVSSAETSRPGSASGRPREKKRVGFTPGTEAVDWSGRAPGAVERTLSSPGPATPAFNSPDHSATNTPTHSRQGSTDFMLPPDSSRSHLPALSPQQTQEIHQAFERSLAPRRPRPAMRRTASSPGPLEDVEVESDGTDETGERAYRRTQAQQAYERAKRLETDERIRSSPSSRCNSPERRPQRGTDIPLEDLRRNTHDSDSDTGLEMKRVPRSRHNPQREAQNLVRKHTLNRGYFEFDTPPSGLRSGTQTPTEEQAYYEHYRPPPEQYRGGILGALMKLYGQGTRSSRSWPASRDTSAATTPTHSPPGSGAATPTGNHWHSNKNQDQSSSSLAHLVGSSASLSSPIVSGLGEQVAQRLKQQNDAKKQKDTEKQNDAEKQMGGQIDGQVDEEKQGGPEKQRPSMGRRSRSANALAALQRISRPRSEEQARITNHIADTIFRQRYMIGLCRALMQYGAPTHRLEEYMTMTARVLEIEAQFLYLPGSMIMSFDDPSTHTTEVKLVRVAQGLDLGKLRDVHEIYKDVVHDHIGVQEAKQRLEEVMHKPDKFSRWFRVLVYGLAAVCVGPFAFQARAIDLPIIFLLGSILGFLQLIVAPKSDLYANVFEVTATVIISFLARAIGSIPNGHGGTIFCFSALAQSGIALILPGYIVLSAALELQSKSLVAGSVRMVYAIIYSLFLGFGIMIGTTLYGMMDPNATSAIKCYQPLSAPYFFPFVPVFTLCLIVINQAKWKQAPVMVVIAFVGYIVNFYSSKRWASSPIVGSTLGALAIGIMANTYSRIGGRVENWFMDLWETRLRRCWKKLKISHMQRWAPRRLISCNTALATLEEGNANDNESMYVRQSRRVGYGLAAAAMLPAIFVQVPSSIAVSGSLVSGIGFANQIAGHATNGTTGGNGTNVVGSTGGLNDDAFTVSYSVVEVAIGITVGLFLSALFIYPLGKRRSGLFSF